MVDAANAARVAKADLIVTVGGGSVTDGAKMVGLCLANDVTRPDQLDAFAGRTRKEGSGDPEPLKASTVRGVSVPTTLSAGEFSSIAGCTDTRRQVKQGYLHPDLIPRSVVLDPAVTVHTPEWLFLSTGIRAVDHAVEALLLHRWAARSPTPPALHALRLLGRGCRGSRRTRAISTRGSTARPAPGCRWPAWARACRWVRATASATCSAAPPACRTATRPA